MVLLGRVELLELPDFGDDLAIESPGSFQLAARALGDLALGLIDIENARPVDLAAVAELPAVVERIDVSPEDVYQFAIADDLRIVDHLHRLLMPGPPGDHFLVGRVDRMSAGETGGNRIHSVDLVVRRLHTPEATAGEYRSLVSVGQLDVAALP